jgi:hypothetical protein
MTEEDARTSHGDNARKIEGTLEVHGHIGSLCHLQPVRKEESAQ